MRIKKEWVLVVLSLTVIFTVNGCALTGNGGEEEEGTQNVVGRYGLVVTKWDTTGDTFISEEPIPFVLDGKDIKDGAPARLVFAKLLGGLEVVTKEIGTVRDNGRIGRPEFTPTAPTVRTETPYRPYARVCYVYNTSASQEFWVVNSGDYPGALEMPTLGTSMNKAPVSVRINPSSAYYQGEIRAIKVNKPQATERNVGVGIINRGEGFVGNNVTSTDNYGEQNRLANFTLEVPTWGGDISLSDSGDYLNCHKTDNGDYWECYATEDIRLVEVEGRPSARLAPTFNFNLTQGRKERKGRIWASSTYRYCLTTPEIGITVKQSI